MSMLEGLLVDLGNGQVSVTYVKSARQIEDDNHEFHHLKAWIA